MRCSARSITIIQIGKKRLMEGLERMRMGGRES